MKFYSLKKILEKDCQYNVIFGERSNGKSYAVLKYIVEQYCKNGGQGALIRRWHEDFKGKRGQSIFTPLVEHDEIYNLSNGFWTGVYYYAGMWYLCKRDPKNPESIIKDEKPFCFGFAITDQEHDKSTSYPNVTTILFDEFISRTGYLNDEFVLFMNTLSTIIRYRNNVKIFMLGNTVNKYCPYFKEMGLNHIEHMVQNTIDVYTYGDSKLKVAVEYCGSVKRQKKPSDTYFAFDNAKLQMITGGAWEIGIYPHKPIDFLRKDIVFTFFIKFNENLLQCEVVMKDKYNFMFIHPKTTKLQHPESDIIFDTETSPLYTRSRKINQGMNKSKVVTRILSYFNNDKVFYSDNETGEVVRNYLEWCKRATILD